MRVTPHPWICVLHPEHAVGLTQLGRGNQALPQAKQVALGVGHLPHHARQRPLQGGTRGGDAAASRQAPCLALGDFN